MSVSPPQLPFISSKLARLSPPSPSTLQQLTCNIQNPRVFRPVGRKKLQSSDRGQGNSFSPPHGFGQSMCLYLLYILRALGTCHPAVSLWPPKSLHPTPIKEHKELLDSLYKPNMTNSCIVYCLIALGCHDSVQHTTAVSLPSLCYVCSEKVMICIDHC